MKTELKNSLEAVKHGEMAVDDAAPVSYTHLMVIALENTSVLKSRLRKLRIVITIPLQNLMQNGIKKKMIRPVC